MLLRLNAGSRYRLEAAADARHAGRVNYGPILRMSNTFVESERNLDKPQNRESPRKLHNLCYNLELFESEKLGAFCSFRAINLGLILISGFRARVL